MIHFFSWIVVVQPCWRSLSLNCSLSETFFFFFLNSEGDMNLWDMFVPTFHSALVCKSCSVFLASSVSCWESCQSPLVGLWGDDASPISKLMGLFKPFSVCRCSLSPPLSLKHCHSTLPSFLNLLLYFHQLLLAEKKAIKVLFLSQTLETTNNTWWRVWSKTIKMFCA